MAQGIYKDMTSEWVNVSTGDSGVGGYCTGEVLWESSWLYGNVHSMTITVIGKRTDGYATAQMWGDAYVDGRPISLGDHKYGTEESFDTVSFNVETDDYGNITTNIEISIGFYSSTAGEEYWSKANLCGLEIDKPQKEVIIDTPDGITCLISEPTLCVGDEFVLTVTVIDAKWNDSPIISVTGATKVSDLKYSVTGDVYIVITGIPSVHTIYLNVTNGVSVSITDSATGAKYKNGSSVEYRTNIKIDCTAEDGYNLGAITANGVLIQNGASIEVTCDTYIIVSANPLGAVQIFTGSFFERFYILIFDGYEWHMYIPFIFDGVEWRMCA